MSAVVDGLFAVLATMGVVPIIRCPKVRCCRRCCSSHCKDTDSPELPLARNNFALRRQCRQAQAANLPTWGSSSAAGGPAAGGAVV